MTDGGPLLALHAHSIKCALVVTVTTALSATVCVSILSLGSLDLIEHEASGTHSMQHIWPQFKISNRRQTVANFQTSKFKAAGSS